MSITTEEAIAHLTRIANRRLVVTVNGKPHEMEPDETDEALRMAIAALERNGTYRRALYLLDATKRLLEKQKNSARVLNLLATTVDYDDADCDGMCLMEDITDLFFDAEYHPEPPKEETP